MAKTFIVSKSWLRRLVGTLYPTKKKEDNQTNGKTNTSRMEKRKSRKKSK